MRYGFVVEGVNDRAIILSILPDAYCVITKGTRMNNRVKFDIESMLNQCNRCFLLVDPDDAGDVIEQMFSKNFPQIQRIHLDKEQCYCFNNKHKVKIGVEHCSEEYLYYIISQYIGY